VRFAVRLSVISKIRILYSTPIHAPTPVVMLTVKGIGSEESTTLFMRDSLPVLSGDARMDHIRTGCSGSMISPAGGFP